MGALCCRQQPTDFDGEVNLFHFSLLNCVGRGSFGKVRVVRHKRTSSLYALKYINKEHCVKMRAVRNVIQERRLLEEIEHPFVVNMRYAFQDDENCFLVLDLMLGGDLRCKNLISRVLKPLSLSVYLDRQGGLPEAVVCFYVAQLSSAIQFLHDNNIMHRDIKPDNILLDERGHAHLTDFNIAVHFGQRSLTSVAGTMAYMAPEVLTKRGYTCYVDWWSLGICAYELIFGGRPFGKKNGDLAYSICHDTLKWPEDVDNKCSQPGILILLSPLERDTSKRLGCRRNGGGFEELKRQAWFKSIDWDRLESKELEPPFVPDAKRNNFDPAYELEELLLDDNPLKAKSRKVNQDHLSVEMRQMEEQFTSYNFERMQRRAYDPPNQIISTTTSSGMESLAPATPVTEREMDNLNVGIQRSSSLERNNTIIHGHIPEGSKKDDR